MKWKAQKQGKFRFFSFSESSLEGVLPSGKADDSNGKRPRGHAVNRVIFPECFILPHHCVARVPRETAATCRLPTIRKILVAKPAKTSD